VGRGLFCVFAEPVGAVRAGLTLLRTKGLESVRLSLHAGAARVTTVNRRLDYFGEVVSRLRGVAAAVPAGSLGITDELISEQGVADVVEGAGDAVVTRRTEDGVWLLARRSTGHQGKP